MLSPLSVSAIVLALSVARPSPAHCCLPEPVSQNKPPFLMLLWSGHSPTTAAKELVEMTSLLEETGVSVEEALVLL